MHKFRWNDTGNCPISVELSTLWQRLARQVLRDAIGGRTPYFEILAKCLARRSTSRFGRPLRRARQRWQLGQ
jgi:hypothetical protein